MRSTQSSTLSDLVRLQDVEAIANIIEDTYLNEQTQRETLSNFKREGLDFLLQQMEDQDIRLRKATALLLCQLLSISDENKEIFCEFQGISMISGGIPQRFGEYLALNPSILEAIQSQCKANLSYWNNSFSPLCWYISLQQVQMQNGTVQHFYKRNENDINKLIDDFIDPSTHIIGFYIFNELKPCLASEHLELITVASPLPESSSIKQMTNLNKSSEATHIDDFKQNIVSKRQSDVQVKFNTSIHELKHTHKKYNSVSFSDGFSQQGSFKMDNNKYNKQITSASSSQRTSSLHENVPKFTNQEIKNTSSLSLKGKKEPNKEKLIYQLGGISNGLDIIEEREVSNPDNSLLNAIYHPNTNSNQYGSNHKADDSFPISLKLGQQQTFEKSCFETREKSPSQYYSNKSNTYYVLSEKKRIDNKILYNYPEKESIFRYKSARYADSKNFHSISSSISNSKTLVSSPNNSTRIKLSEQPGKQKSNIKDIQPVEQNSFSSPYQNVKLLQISISASPKLKRHDSKGNLENPISFQKNGSESKLVSQTQKQKTEENDTFKYRQSLDSNLNSNKLNQPRGSLDSTKASHGSQLLASQLSENKRQSGFKSPQVAKQSKILNGFAQIFLELKDLESPSTLNRDQRTSLSGFEKHSKDKYQAPTDIKSKEYKPTISSLKSSMHSTPNTSVNVLVSQDKADSINKKYSTYSQSLLASYQQGAHIQQPIKNTSRNTNLNFYSSIAQNQKIEEKGNGLKSPVNGNSQGSNSKKDNIGAQPSAPQVNIQIKNQQILNKYEHQGKDFNFLSQKASSSLIQDPLGNLFKTKMGSTTTTTTSSTINQPRSSLSDITQMKRSYDVWMVDYAIAQQKRQNSVNLNQQSSIRSTVTDSTPTAISNLRDNQQKLSKSKFSSDNYLQEKNSGLLASKSEKSKRSTISSSIGISSSKHSRVNSGDRSVTPSEFQSLNTFKKDLTIKSPSISIRTKMFL